MSHKPTPKFDDPHLQKYFEKAAKRDHRSEHVFRRVLHVIERFIAENGITRKAVSEYAPLFPDKAIRTLVESEVIYSVAQ